MIAIKPLADGALGGIRPGWVSLLHIARQVKAAPQDEEPEKYLFWGAAGQFVDFLAKVRVCVCVCVCCACELCFVWGFERLCQACTYANPSVGAWHEHPWLFTA